MILTLLLTTLLFQQPAKADVVKMTPASSQKLKDAVQKIKDLQTQIELGQRDAQNTLLQIVIETVKSHPGFNEQDYNVALEDGDYVFRLKEDKNAKPPSSGSSAAAPVGKQHP